ncbi:hypothetical protein PanWU01x14_369890 [Parasponia andersonii]|uniref:Uncharacterized protein n=1 Tax=Parasponia andersonii TaxID=3476 RepID=A0A2P5A4I3_PARAD|nr:hypothetical protein PanWU01x14_369890 [Parasponia andersonii]
MVHNALLNNHYLGNEPVMIEIDGVMMSPNMVKFELQVIEESARFAMSQRSTVSVLRSLCYLHCQTNIE